MTVLIEAIHAVKPLTNTAFDRWVEWYGNDVMPALARNGFDVVGAFKRSSGPMGEDVLLMRFASMADYERAGLSLRQDAAFLKSVGSSIDQWTVRESAKAATLAPYATEQRLERMMAERPAKPRQYLQAVLQMKTGGQPAAYEAIGQLVEMTDAGTGIKLATAYETTIGSRGELTDLWASETLPDLTYRPGDPLAALMASLREAAPEESISFLNPLPYSRLQ